VRELLQAKPVRLSRAQVETLAIVAYRQPITRPEIDEVRGVDTGSALKILLERDLVRTIGRREEPGRPLLYGTSRFFLEFFGLRSLRDLPMLREYTELSEESQASLTARLSQVGESPAERSPPPRRGAAPSRRRVSPPQRTSRRSDSRTSTSRRLVDVAAPSSAAVRSASAP
jgi:segregation and condensation protein B